MSKTKTLMTMYASKVIAELGVCQKKQIKDKLYDYWEKYETINKEFVMLITGLGWMFQDLKKEGVVVSNGLEKSKARWKITTYNPSQNEILAWQYGRDN